MAEKNNFEWWEKPKTIEEIDSYLEKVLQHTGDNIWKKIIRPCIQESLESDLKTSSNESNDGQKGD